MNSSVIKSELSDEKPHFCAKCDKQIQDRFFLKALNLYWHEGCLKCGCCDCRLGDVGTSLYTRENFLLCKSDYMRLYGNTGLCSACNKLIPAFEMVMRAKRNVYHLECFACQQCSHRFCVGDRFYLCDNKILCESDYEDRILLQNNGMSMQQQQQQQQQQCNDNKINIASNNTNDINQNFKSHESQNTTSLNGKINKRLAINSNHNHNNNNNHMPSFNNNNNNNNNEYLNYNMRSTNTHAELSVR